MQVHYYKTTWGRAWQKYNQKKHGYNSKFADVKPLNKIKKTKAKPKKQRDTTGLLTKEILEQRRMRWEAKKNDGQANH